MFRGYIPRASFLLRRKTHKPLLQEVLEHPEHPIVLTNYDQGPKSSNFWLVTTVVLGRPKTSQRKNKVFYNIPKSYADMICGQNLSTSYKLLR